MGVRQDDPSTNAAKMRTWREELRAKKLCVISPKHGPAAPGRGGRCAACADKRNKARRVNHDPVAP